MFLVVPPKDKVANHCKTEKRRSCGKHGVGHDYLEPKNNKLQGKGTPKNKDHHGLK